MTTAWHRDPFASPHGGTPMVVAPRQNLVAKLNNLIGRFSAQRSSRNLVICGPTGSGKTTVLDMIAKEFHDRGWLPVRVDLRPRMDLASQLVAGIERAVVSRGGRKILPKPRRWLGKIQASARIPFTPVDVQYNPVSEQDTRPNYTEAAWNAVQEYLYNQTPVVILIDEGDFLTVEESEDVLVPLVDRAARHDLPFAIVGAGVGLEFHNAMYGESTFPPSLFNDVQLVRLSDAESHHLLVATARLGGQDWSSVDLREAVRLCNGIPRRLHDFGSTMFCDTTARDLDQAARESLVPIVNSLRKMHSQLRPLAQLVRDRSAEFLGTTGASFDEYYSHLYSALRSRLSDGEIDLGVEECMHRGLLYVGPGWVEMLAPRC